MDDQERLREQRARRKLAKHDFRLNKTPSRSWLRTNFGPGYQILYGSTVVEGCTSHEYEMTLEQVEDWIQDKQL